MLELCRQVVGEVVGAEAVVAMAVIAGTCDTRLSMHHTKVVAGTGIETEAGHLVILHTALMGVTAQCPRSMVHIVDDYSGAKALKSSSISDQ